MWYRMTLIEMQILFTKLVGRFLVWCDQQGLSVVLKEAYRPPETAVLYARRGTGIINSLHCDSLAVDVELYQNGSPVDSLAEYQPLGAQWKSQHVLARWGGDFVHRKDAYHFSLAWQGRE